MKPSDFVDTLTFTILQHRVLVISEMSQNLDYGYIFKCKLLIMTLQ